MSIQLEEASWSSVILGFYHAVDWSEPWIIGILMFHGLLYSVFLFTRKKMAIQMTLWGFSLVIVGLASYINTYGHEHWEEFATQDYFDENGFFVSVVISLPLLLLSILILVQLLLTTMDLLVKVKVAEIKNNKKKTQ